MDQPPEANRRKYPRVRTDVPVLVQRAEGDTQLARGVDLGLGGIRFECFGLDLAVGEVIEATLALGNNKSVTVVGKTVRVTNIGERQDVALAFERIIDAEMLKRLCEVGQADESEGIPGSGNASVITSRQGRAEVSLPAIYFLGGARGEGLVGNLSRDGLFLRGPMLPKEGEHVVIKFETPNGREITVEGTVRWAKHVHADDKGVPLGFGVELSSYENDYLVVVEDFLRKQDP